MTATRRARTIDIGSAFAPSLDGMCELLLVRHGEQALPREITVGDAIDPPLSEQGERQVAAVGTRLAHVEIAAVYSSPLVRARRTGEAIASPHGLDVVIDPGLVEYDPWSSFPRDRSMFDVLGESGVAEIFRAHARTKSFSVFPYGEDPARFRARVVDALGAIMARHPGERVVVTCHGGVINAFLADVWGSNQDMPVRVHHTSITTCRGADSRRAVLVVNDFAHVVPFQTTPADVNL